LQAYSPYRQVDWTLQWKETPKINLLKQIKKIVRTLEKETVKIARLVEEAERRAELERQEQERRNEQRRIEEVKRRTIQAQKDSLEELKRVIENWGDINQIEHFFRDAEAQAANLDPEKRARVLERLKLAREMIGSIDALDYFRRWRTPSERLEE
jgi:GTP1/Obg family GTP-binding protein